MSNIGALITALVALYLLFEGRISLAFVLLVASCAH